MLGAGVDINSAHEYSYHPDGKKRKAKLEDGFQEGGYRTGSQVLSNSAAAVVAAFLWNVLFVPSSIHAKIAHTVGLNVTEALSLESTPTYDRSTTGWCPLDDAVSKGYSRLFLFAVLGCVSPLASTVSDAS